LRQLDIHFAKRLYVRIRAEDRQLHAAEHDRDVRVALAGAVDDSLQVRPHLRDRDAAERIVDAELEHQHIDGLTQELRHATKTAGGRVAADALR
jgi:hypothetical protein